ncbi:hypothetical protein ABEW19_30145 [Paenibacillus illinoisensis]|uniref:hypothetical protein n=1 Tax=Paenibacillus illinoisensis TaxID=59845 RepID=UPI003D2E6C13
MEKKVKLQAGFSEILRHTNSNGHLAAMCLKLQRTWRPKEHILFDTEEKKQQELHKSIELS